MPDAAVNTTTEQKVTTTAIAIKALGCIDPQERASFLALPTIGGAF
jgi:hypothetical protein